MGQLVNPASTPVSTGAVVAGLVVGTGRGGGEGGTSGGCVMGSGGGRVVQLMKMPKFMISPITMGTTFLKSLWHDKVFKLILTILACQQ